MTAETDAEYAKVKSQFATKKWLKSDWCNANLRQMAEEVGQERAYVFVYPVTSSVHHLDIVGLGAHAEQGDVETLPSWKNIELAFTIAGLGVFTALDCYSEVAGLGAGDQIAALFQAYKEAQDKSQRGTR